MNSARTFIAIELDEALKAALGRVQALLGEQMPARSVRWVSPDSIHLTLKFLGDTPVEKVDEVKAALARAAAEVQSFPFVVGGVGCFPTVQQPGVVWVGLQEPTGALSRLQKAVESHVVPLGFPAEKRPFSPHLTLGRVQRYASSSDARQIGNAVATSIVGALREMSATTVAYIKSDLRPSGAVYTMLFEARLGKI